MSDDEEYLIRRYGGTNPNDWSSKVYDDGGPLPPGQTPINLAPLPIEGELPPTPPEPPRDHVLVSRPGYVFMWSDELDNWLEVDSEHGYPMSWEDVYRYNKPLTAYKPVKEIS